MPDQRRKVDLDGVVLATLDDGDLVEQSHVLTRQALRFLTQPSEIHGLLLGTHCHRCSDEERGARGEARSDGEVGGDSKLARGPTQESSKRCDEGRERPGIEGDARSELEVLRGEIGLDGQAVVSLVEDRSRAEIDRHGKRSTTCVVGVIADQVDAPRSEGPS